MRNIDEIMSALEACTGLIRRQGIREGEVYENEECVTVYTHSDTNWDHFIRIEKAEDGTLTYRKGSHFRDTFCSPDAPHEESAPIPLDVDVVKKYQKSIIRVLSDPQHMGKDWEN